MGTSDLPDMYAQSLRIKVLIAKGILIRQITSPYVTTTVPLIYNFTFTCVYTQGDTTQVL